MLDKKEDTSILVSICCITYNHASYIRQCLDGFIMQKTDFTFEILIHDDASTDGTEEIIREYAIRYPETIKPLYEKENQWVLGRRGSKTFNYPRAKGKYIALCEGDDYWIDPLKLQKQVDILECNSEIGLVRSNVSAFYESENKLDENFMSKFKIKDTLDDFLMYGWFAAPCTWLFRSSYLPKILALPRFNVGDYPLILTVISESKIKYIHDITAVYRIRTESASHFTTFDQQIKFLNGIFEIKSYFLKKTYKNDLESKVLKTHYLNMAKISLKYLKPKSTMIYMFQYLFK